MDEKRIAYVLTGDPSGLVRAFSSSSSAATQLGATVQAELGRASAASSTFVSQTGRVTASLNQATLAERAREAAAAKFVQTLERRIAIAGKSETELLKMQAAELGVSEKVKGLIQQLEAGSRGFNAYGMSAAQTAAALRGVPAQITDIVVGLQGGQNVITVMLQQGGQLRDMFGGLRPALSALATTALSMVTPFTLGATALAAIGFAAAGAESKLRGLQSLYVQFLATDRQISTVGIDNLISSISKLPGVSRDAAKAMVQEFARLRDIAPADMTGFASLATNLAAALGEAPEEGAKRLAAALEEPARGAKALDEALGILSAEQMLSIQLMERHGDKAGAQKILFDALRVSVGGLADRGMTPLQRATHDLGLAWDETMGKIGGSSVLRGMNEWLAEGIRNVASFVRWLDRLTDSPVWRYALTPGGPFGWAMRAANEAKAAGGGGSGGNTGGASGSWGPPNGGASASWGASAAAAAAAEEDEQKRRLLERTAAFRSQAAEVRQLNKDLADLRKLLADAQAAGQGDSLLAKEYADRIDGISEKLASLREKAERSVRDDAGQRMLQNIREQNAALEAQLLERDKLGAAARAQAAFEQQLADLRGKANLTVDQKALLAKADQIRLELEWGVALEKARAIQEELAKEEKERLKNLEQYNQRYAQLQSSMQSAADLRGEQYDRRLSAFTMGDQVFQRTQEAESIYREFRRYQEQLDKSTPQDQLGSAEYKARTEYIKDRLRDALAAHADYYSRLDELQGDWSVGANRAFANFMADAANVAKRSEQAFSGLFNGLTSAVAKWATGAKVSFKEVGQQFVAMLLEMQMRAAVSQLFGGGGGGVNLLGSVLGALGGLSGGTAAAGPSAASGLGGQTWLNAPSTGGVGLRFAQGAAFDRGNVIPFANGAAFANKIVSKPTRFDIGEMGEAGPEAIVPLAKMPGGALGVRMIGGPSQPVSMSVQIHQYNTIDASVDRDSVVVALDAAKEQTKAETVAAVNDLMNRGRMKVA